MRKEPIGWVVGVFVDKEAGRVNHQGTKAPRNTG